LKRGLSIGEYMNNYIKLLAHLINMNVEIEEEDKAVILLIFFLMKSMRPSS